MHTVNTVVLMNTFSSVVLMNEQKTKRNLS